MNDNEIRYDKIITTNSRGKQQEWTIVLRLIEECKLPNKRTANWEDTFKVVEIKQEYYNNKPLNNIIAQYWTEHGQVGSTITRSIPTFVLTGKNIGKKNATNAFTQGLSEIKSKYTKNLAVAPKGVVYPMAAQKLDESPKNNDKKIVYPAHIQPKLDGLRCVVHFNKKVVISSRRKKPIKMPNIEKELLVIYKKINKKYPGLYLDGELYIPGKSLQYISGVVRNETKENNVKLYLFDVFMLDKKMSFSDRHEILKDVFKLTNPSLLVQVDTYIVNSPEEELKYYSEFLENGYEGSMVRNSHSYYEWGDKKEKRSWHLRKHKPRFDDEFKIIGYKKGMDNAIIWELQTNTVPPVNFTSVPNMTYEERFGLYNNMTEELFNSKYKNKLLTVEYDDLSEDGVPLRAKVKCIRID